MAPSPAHGCHGCLVCGAEPQNQVAVEFDTDRGNYVYAAICGPNHMELARARAAGISEGIWDEIAGDHAEFCSAKDDDGEPCELGDCDGAHEAHADRLNELVSEAEIEAARNYDPEGAA